MDIIEEAANTFIELVVTLSIMLIVGSLVFAIYLQSMRSVNRWQDRVVLESQAHLLISRLATDIRDGIDLERVTYQTWLIRKNDQESTVYAYEDRFLFRNKDALSDSVSQINRFEIIPRDMNASTIEKVVAFRITVRNKTDSLHLASKAFFRSPQHWRPIKNRLPR